MPKARTEESTQSTTPSVDKLKKMLQKWHRVAKTKSEERPLTLILDLDLTTVAAKQDLEKHELAADQTLSKEIFTVRRGNRPNFPFHLLNPKQMADLMNFVLSTPKNNVMILNANSDLKIEHQYPSMLICNHFVPHDKKCGS